MKRFDIVYCVLALVLAINFNQRQHYSETSNEIPDLKQKLKFPHAEWVTTNFDRSSKNYTDRIEFGSWHDDVFEWLHSDLANSVNGDLYVEGNVRVDGLSFGTNEKRMVMVDQNGMLQDGPSTHYLSIPSVAFQPLSNAADYFIEYFPYAFIDEVGAQFVLYAPVELPHNSTITRIIFYYFDNSIQQIVFELRRRKHTDMSSPDALTNNATAGESENLRTLNISSITTPQVNNVLYHYYISAIFNSTDGQNLGIRSALIFYQLG
jgi:hypothetical protein